jgi:hypothetical protein
LLDADVVRKRFSADRLPANKISDDLPDRNAVQHEPESGVTTDAMRYMKV